MIAPSRPLLRNAAAADAVDSGIAATPLDRVWQSFPFYGPAAAVLFGFLCFLPYPAIPFGNATGIQTGSLISIALALPCIFLPWKGRPFMLTAALVAPMSLSVVKVALTDGSQLDLCFKSMLVTGFSGVTLLAAQRVTPRYALALLTGIAAATLIHVAVGFWQMYSFPRGQFPLLWIYVNPTFLSVQENADTIVQYIQRPFGLFPEPSAMSSSLAPWVLFWTAEAMGLVRLRKQRPARWQRAMFATAAVGALVLIIVSKSGHAVFTLAGLGVLSAIWLIRAKATSANYFAIVMVFCVAMPLVIWLGVNSLSGRVSSEGKSGDSWHDRAKSLEVGFDLLVDGSAATWVFGVGPGLTSPAIKQVAGFEAVWSVLLPYVYQTGVIGLAALLFVAVVLYRNWRGSAFSSVFATFFVVWLVGVTITTSYGQLLPLWVAMGWLTVWPEVCASPRRSAKALAARMTASRNGRERPRQWHPAPERLPAGSPAAIAAAAAAAVTGGLLTADTAVSRQGGPEGATS